MNSQPAHLQDLAACSAHSSSAAFGGSEAENNINNNNNSNRHDFLPLPAPSSAHPPHPPHNPHPHSHLHSHPHPHLHLHRSAHAHAPAPAPAHAHAPSLASASDHLMGLRYMPISADESRFSPESGGSHSPVYSIEPAGMHNPSSSSTLTFPFPNVYQPNSLSGSTFSSAGNPYLSPNASLYMTDIKPRINAIPSSSIGPPSRSPNNFSHPSSPISTRELYTSATPHLRRSSDLLTRSPPGSTSRSSPLSPSSSNGFTSPTSMGEPGHGAPAGPPLDPTELFHTLQTADGTTVRPELMGRIDKGFFLADNDWTCYRRNYFSLVCAFTLHPLLPPSTLLLNHKNGTPMPVQGFCLSIAAVVDGRDGKTIELVQHTPKRDKGPQLKPQLMAVVPKPPISSGLYGSSDTGLGSRSIYDQGLGPTPSGSQQEACFERIQFKNATANNGKRRAAQQYYHLLIELFADLGPQTPDRYVKVASRMSAQMVVRGRSPGHYQNERRESNGSGGAGASGPGGSSGYSTGGSSLTGGSLGMSGASASLGGSSGYGSHHPHHPHHPHQYRATTGPLHIPMDPVMSAEEAKGIDEPNCYLYYPAPILENASAAVGAGEDGRYHLPNMPDYAGIHAGKVKQEYGQYHNGTNGYALPSLTSTHHGLHSQHPDGFGWGGRHCGRWDGQHESKGCFPTAVMQQELNMT